MTSHETAMSEAHFSGINTRLVVEHLRDKMPPGTLGSVLEAAGETRSMDVLLDDASWSSYEQVRSLLGAAGVVMGGPRSLAPIGRDANMLSDSTPEVLESVRALGSPAALYAASAEGGDGGLVGIGKSEGWELGPHEWMLSQQFFAGFEAFPEYCSLLSGLLSMPPRLFGYPPAEVVEEQCQVDGAADASSMFGGTRPTIPGLRADYFEHLVQGLEMRLDALRRTVADIVSAESIDSVLTAPRRHGCAHRRRTRIHAGPAPDTDSQPDRSTRSVSTPSEAESTWRASCLLTTHRRLRSPGRRCRVHSATLRKARRDRSRRAGVLPE